MIEQGFEIHRWLWSSVFVLPLLFMTLYGVVERWDRSGNIRKSGLLLGAFYGGTILGVGPFAAGMLHASPLGGYIPGIGGLAYDPLYFGAFLTFAMLWTEPEIEQFKLLRGFFKLLLLAVILQLGVMVWDEGPPLDPLIGSGTVPEWRAAFTLTAWTVLIAGWHTVYRISWKRWAANSVMFTLVAVVSLVALVGGGVLGGGIVLAVSILLLPLVLGFARTASWDLSEAGWRQLYGLGLSQLPLVPFIRSQPWRKDDEV